MLNLKLGAQILQQVPEGGQFKLPNGDVVSPAYEGWVNTEGYALTSDVAVEPVVESVSKEQLLAQLAYIRDTAIAAGIVLNGFPVQTDEVSQQRLTGAAVAALLDPTLVVNWKGADGEFIEMSAQAIIEVAQAVRSHVQKCFDIENIVSQKINEEQITTIEGLKAVWDQTVQSDGSDAILM